MSHKILPPARKQNKDLDPLAGIIARLEAMGAPGEAKAKAKPGPFTDARKGMADMLFNFDPQLGAALARAAKETKEKNYRKYNEDK